MLDKGSFIELLSEMMHRVRLADSNEALAVLQDEYRRKLCCDENEQCTSLLADIFAVADELVSLRNGSTADNDSAMLLASLNEQERLELEEAGRIIDNNLFDYHFQPIVSVVDGSIYSYEALMRPRSELCPSPFHIIKYAELTDRLVDIERCTFFNILGYIDENTDVFGDRKVFINSFPEAQLDDDDMRCISTLLEKHADTVTVEMTEQSELDDEDYDRLKAIYRELGVEIAIDDYGTGYSNVQNLLRYMPDYVKIDRSLLSDIQSNAKKMHFVREIIDFCHDNGIKALAEGIETSEELQTVIHLGADLIQGYYTARPSAAVADSISYEVRQEIRSCYQERVDGRKQHIYAAKGAERVLLDRLASDHYDCIQISSGKGNVTVAGTPGTDVPIHIDIKNGFIGTVVLDNANLCSIKERPCIDIEENCDVMLVLNGENFLKYGGIRVPKSSKLTVCGDGLMTIFIEANAFYGIGNDVNSEHGDLIFEQGVTIQNHSASCVCIGSGKGGRILLRRGKFNIEMRSAYGVGVGSYTSDTSLELYAVDLTLNGALERGVAIGTLTGDLTLDAEHCSIKIRLSGKEVIGIGSLSGSRTEVSISEAGTVIDISAETASAIAALRGNTYFNLNKASAAITVIGQETLVIGGFGDETQISTLSSDMTLELGSVADVTEYLCEDKIKIVGGRTKYIVNEIEIQSLADLYTR